MKKRNKNIDIIKTTALFLVFLVHAFSHLNYYEMRLSFSVLCVVSTFVRQIAVCCISMFIFATGYLQCGREIQMNKARLKKLLRILIPFWIVTVVLIIYYRITGTPVNHLAMFFGFDSDSYGWYVDMYIGLYLLMPLINKGYSALDRNQKKLLIGILVFLTYFPSAVSFRFDAAVNYWTAIYPVTLYVTAGYIKEYEIKPKPALLAAAAFVSAAANAVLQIKANYLEKFEWNELVGNNSIFVFVTSVSICMLILQIKTSDKERKLLKVISDSTLPSYLISKLIDLILLSAAPAYISVHFPYNYGYLVIWALFDFTAANILGIAIGRISEKITGILIKNKAPSD